MHFRQSVTFLERWREEKSPTHLNHPFTIKLPGVWVCFSCSALPKGFPAHSWMHKAGSTLLVMEVSVERAGSKSWPQFSLRSYFSATVHHQCVCDPDPGLPPHPTPCWRGHSWHLPEPHLAPGPPCLAEWPTLLHPVSNRDFCEFNSRPVHTQLLTQDLHKSAVCHADGLQSFQGDISP